MAPAASYLQHNQGHDGLHRQSQDPGVDANPRGPSPDSSTEPSRNPSTVSGLSKSQSWYYEPAPDPAGMVDSKNQYSYSQYAYDVAYPTPAAKSAAEDTDGVHLASYPVGPGAAQQQQQHYVEPMTNPHHHAGYQYIDASAAYDQDPSGRVAHFRRQDSHAGLLEYAQDSPGFMYTPGSAPSPYYYNENNHTFEQQQQQYQQAQHQQRGPKPPRRAFHGCLSCCAPGWRWRWHDSWNMYLFFLFGLLCAIGHHIFYTVLDGRPSGTDNQITMLRYGTVLAYASKAGLAAAAISALKQRVWTTVRTRLMSVAAVDALFSATEDILSMFNWEFLGEAKTAAALAFFVWLAPLVVILTANTLLVESRTINEVGKCPGVRTLNFDFEATTDWRNGFRIDRLYEISVSIWNTTRPADADPPPKGWFDYYTGPSPAWTQQATIGAYLEQVVTRKNASLDTCGSGWNCTFDVSFTAPGYKCTELASGVGAKPAKLQQESGSIASPIDMDILLPKGKYAYYVHASGGDYSPMQMKDTGPGGVPTTDPPWPRSFGALRTEPVIWVAHATYAHGTDSPDTPQDKTQPGWGEAFVPKMFACEHYETAYTARFNYTDGIQTALITNRTFLAPVINTTYVPGKDARDGTGDNTTAVPESNYILPLPDVLRYRRVAAYHSMGYLLRDLINGTVEIDGDLNKIIQNTHAIQTKLLDKRNSYFPYPNVMDLVQGLYEDLILSMFGNPQFAAVVWAADPKTQSGTLRGDQPELGYECERSRTVNVYSYHRRDLWIVYGIAVSVALGCVLAGWYALRENGGVVRDTKFSSIVAATRGPALEKLAWPDGRREEVEVSRGVRAARIGYGYLDGLNENLDRGGDRAEEVYWKGGERSGRSSVVPDGNKGPDAVDGGDLSHSRFGFGLEGDVRIVPPSGLFHR